MHQKHRDKAVSSRVKETHSHAAKELYKTSDLVIRTFVGVVRIGERINEPSLRLLMPVSKEIAEMDKQVKYDRGRGGNIT